jgi:hypothetical protein
MRFAFRNADDRAGEPAADETPGQHDAHAAAPAGDANGALDSTALLALYDEYLSELDKVPTLRDPVLPETSGPHLNLEEKIREIVREELAKLDGDTPKRSSGRSRKRRKR